MGGLEPWSLLIALATAQGLRLASRWAMIRVLTQSRLAGWRPPPGVETVADWWRAMDSRPTWSSGSGQPL